MIVFADTDILIELAALDLLGEFLAAFELKNSDVFVLPRELKRLSSTDIMDDYGHATSSRAVAFARGASKILNYDQVEHVLLTGIQGVDPGEAVLYSATATMAVDFVVTGDARALRGLVSASAAQPICSRLSGKIICLEQLLLELIDQIGFAAIREKVVRSTTTNISLNTIFRSGGQASQAAVVSWLKSRVDNLRAETGALLSEYHGV